MAPSLPLLVVWLAVGLAAFVPGALAATGYGFHELAGPEDVVPIEGAAPLYVCVAGPADAQLVVLRSGPANAPVNTAFLVAGGTAACAVIAPRVGLQSATNGTVVRVLVLALEPSTVSAPGVVRLAAPGEAMLYPDLGSRASLHVRIGAGDGRVSVVDVDTLREVTLFAEGGSHRVAASQLDGWVYVVLASADDGTTVLVEWKDPDRYPRAPKLAHLLTVVVAAALVIVPTGREPYPLRARVPSPAT